jgi:hypothetical protein
VKLLFQKTAAFAGRPFASQTLPYFKMWLNANDLKCFSGLTRTSSQEHGHAHLMTTKATKKNMGVSPISVG